MATTTSGQAIALNYGYCWITGLRLNYRVLQNTNNSHLDWTRVGMWALGEGEMDGCEELWDTGQERLLYTSENDDTVAFHFHRGCDAVIGSGSGATSIGPDQGVDGMWTWLPPGVQPLHYHRIAYYALFLKLLINNPPGDVDQENPDFWADLNPVGLWRGIRCRLFDATGQMVGYAFTTNPAWHFVDIILRRKVMPEYLLDLNNGPDDLSAGARNRFDWGAICAAANYFDEILDNGNRRFEGSYSFSQQTSLQAVLSQILQVSRSYMKERNGQIGLYCDQPRASVFTFTRKNADNFSANDTDLHTAPNRYVAKFRDLLIPSAADIVSISAPDHANPTVQTLNPHPFAAADRIVIGGTNTKYDSNWVVDTVPDADSVTTFTMVTRGSNYPSFVGAGGKIGLLYSRFQDRSPEFNHHRNQLAKGAIGVGLPRQRNKVKVETDFATSTYDQIARISYYQRARALGPDVIPYVTPVAAELTAPLFAVDEGTYTDVIDTLAELGVGATSGAGVPWINPASATASSGSTTVTLTGATGSGNANPSNWNISTVSGQGGVPVMSAKDFTFPDGGTANSLTLGISGTFANTYEGSSAEVELSLNGGISFTNLLSEGETFSTQTITRSAGPYDLSQVIIRVTVTAMLAPEGHDTAEVQAEISGVSATLTTEPALTSQTLSVPSSYSGPFPDSIILSFVASGTGTGPSITVNGAVFGLTAANARYTLNLGAIPGAVVITAAAGGDSVVSVNNLQIGVSYSETSEGDFNFAIGIEPGDRITVDDTLSPTYAGDYEVLTATPQLAGSSANTGDSIMRSPISGSVRFTLGPYSDNNFFDTSNPEEAGWDDVPGSQPGNDSSYTTIDLEDGEAAFFSGSGADSSTFSMPSTGFNPANLLAWASPQGFLEGNEHLHFIAQCDADLTRLLHLVYSSDVGVTWAGDANFAALTWRTLHSANVTHVGAWTFVELTLSGGEKVCWGKGRVAASAPITIPDGYSLANSVCLAFPNSGTNTDHPAHGFRAYVGTDGRAHHDYQDGENNQWQGDTNCLFFGWKNNMGTVTVANGWVTIPLATGRIFAAGGFSILDSRAGGVLTPNFPTTGLKTVLMGGKFPLPPNLSATTLQTMTGANSFQITGNDCHGQKECFVDGDLNALTSFEDGEGNVWYGSSGTFGLICDNPAG